MFALTRLGRKSTQDSYVSAFKKTLSRKGAKAQIKILETRQRFAPFA
jgi:hypothetical protein